VIAGLLLAAGSGSRLGTPKASLVLGGRSLVELGISLLTEGGCSPVVVVLGAAPDVAAPGALLVVAPDWETGMGASLRAGLAALPPEVRAVVVALVDMPLVGPAAVQRLIATPTPGAAVATYDGRRGNPVLLTRAVWPAVLELAVGDVGARTWMAANAALVVDVDCDGTGSPVDIDTAEDLARLRGNVSRRAGS
jgi:CTP:molybdopterin cytidylyltransferase MocA